MFTVCALQVHADASERLPLSFIRHKMARHQHKTIRKHAHIKVHYLFYTFRFQTWFVTFSTSKNTKLLVVAITGSLAELIHCYTSVEIIFLIKSDVTRYLFIANALNYIYEIKTRRCHTKIYKRNSLYILIKVLQVNIMKCNFSLINCYLYFDASRKHICKF